MGAERTRPEFFMRTLVMLIILLGTTPLFSLEYPHETADFQFYQTR